jgi:hypothetical protein
VAAARILLFVGIAFLVVALLRTHRDGWRVGPAPRTWLLVGTIFVAISVFLAR